MLNIPVSIIIYSDKHQKHGQLKLFCWMKDHSTQGFIAMDSALIEKALEETGIKTKITYRKYVNDLLKLRWISFDQKRKLYHLNSFMILHKRTKLKTKQGAIWDFNDYTGFKAFMYGAIIAYMGKIKRLNDKRQKKNDVESRSEVKKERLNKSSEIYYSLPVTYLAKILGISKSKVVKMKNKAVQTGFLNIKKDFHQTSMNANETKLARKYGPADGYKLRIRFNKGYIQLPDKIYSGIKIKRKNNL